MAEKTELPTIQPFSNGSQYGDWTASNCDSCTKAWKGGEDFACDIELALSRGYIGDGTISREIAERMGLAERRYVWPCKEHDPPFKNVVDGVKVFDAPAVPAAIGGEG